MGLQATQSPEQVLGNHQKGQSQAIQALVLSRLMIKFQRLIFSRMLANVTLRDAAKSCLFLCDDSLRLLMFVAGSFCMYT